MRTCLICRARSVTNLCEACADELDTPPAFVPEQILSGALRPLDAALLDRWGRLHRLEAQTAIGRVPIARGVAIMHGVVSRQHATIARGADGRLGDHRSRRQRHPQRQPVSAGEPLAAGDRLTFGAIGMYFVIDDGRLIDATPDEIASVTVRPESGRPALSSRARAPDDDTFSGMPTVELTFLEAPSGGGGYLDVRNRRVQLTDTQFELLAMMARRMCDEAAIASIVRGFVPTGQLIADLP
jgi:hypothetical protein